MVGTAAHPELEPEHGRMARPVPGGSANHGSLYLHTHPGAVTAVTVALVTGFAGVAWASSQPATQSTVQTSSNKPRTSVGSTQGFNLYNYSADTFDFVKTDGKLPAPPTGPITTATKVNFEIDSPAFSVDSGSAYYNVVAPDGSQVGTFKLTLYSNGDADFSQTWTNGYQLVGTGGTGDSNIYIEDAVGSPNTEK
jgi:hypothetical protein